MTKTTISATAFILTILVCETLCAAEHQVTDSTELETAIRNAVDGDVITLVGPGPFDLTDYFAISANITFQSSDGLPRVINIDEGNVLDFSHGPGKGIHFKNVNIAGGGSTMNNLALIRLYNGGTVHVDGGNSAFEGNTIIYDGYWQLENNAIYGVSGGGLFGVDIDGAVSGSGTISGNDNIIYGSVLPGFFVNQGGYTYQPGTLIFTDATSFESESRYMPTLWADGTGALATGMITVQEGATIYLNFRPGDYSQGEQTYTTIASNQFVVSKPGFIDANYSGDTGEITLNSLNTDYFASQLASGNLQSFATQFDAMLADPNTSDLWWDKLSAMSLAIENGDNINRMLQSLTGAQRANTIGLSLMTPKELAFRHIGQKPVSRHCYNKNLWFQPFYRYHAIHDSADASGFDVSQPGFFIGFDQYFTRRSYGGIFTGYSAPKLSAEDYRADTDVFTFAMLAGTRFDNGWDAKTWAVFGFDNIRTNRSATDSDPFGYSIYGNAPQPLSPNGNSPDDLNDGFYGKTDGWSMGIGIEAGRTWVRRLNRYCDFSLRPFVGLDYEQANQSGFTESGNEEFAIHYLGGSLHRGLVRTGISATTSAYAFDLTGRVMYSGTIFGDKSPKSKTILPSLMPDLFTVRGNDCGRHFVSTGFDATLWLNENRSRYLATTYEASMGHRLTSHTLMLAFVQRF